MSVFLAVSQIPLLALTYPWDYTRTLIQLGHEPIPKKIIKFWGREYYYLPSGFSYVAFLRRDEGFSGLYRGFAAKAMQQIAYSTTSDFLAKRFGPADEIKDDEVILKKDDDLPVSPAALVLVAGPRPPKASLTKEYAQLLIKELVSNCLCNITASLAAFPFYVAHCRLVAQYIGKENIYGSVLDVFAEFSFDRNGLERILPCLIPFLLREACLSIAWTLVKHATSYFLPEDDSDEDLDGYLDEDDSSDEEYEDDFNLDSKFLFAITTKTSYAAISPYLYPLWHVATRMSVCGTNLLAGQQPYGLSWRRCYRYLKENKIEKMGSQLLSNRRTTPVVTVS